MGEFYLLLAAARADAETAGVPSIKPGFAKGAAFHVFMSDLTYDYIHLNAEYHT